MKIIAPPVAIALFWVIVTHRTPGKGAQLNVTAPAAIVYTNHGVHFQIQAGAYSYRLSDFRKAPISKAAPRITLNGRPTSLENFVIKLMEATTSEARQPFTGRG